MKKKILCTLALAATLAGAVSCGGSSEQKTRLDWVNGDGWVSGYYSSILLDYAVTHGKAMKKDGTQVWVNNVQPFEVTASNYNNWKTYINDDSNGIYTQAETNAFLSNADENEAGSAFVTSISNYSLAERTQAKQNASSAEKTAKSGKILYNIYGSGSTALDQLAKRSREGITQGGYTSDVVNHSFQIDNLISDIVTRVSGDTSIKGVSIWAPAGALAVGAASAIENINKSRDADHKVWYALSDKVDDSVKSVLTNTAEYPYFAGAVGPANADYGTKAAQYAIAKGWKTCIVTTSAEGDASDQPRYDAFKAAFEGSGRTIHLVNNATDVVSLENVRNRLANVGEVDFIYGVGSTYANTALTALEDYDSYNTKVITSGLEPEVLELLNKNKTETVISTDKLSFTGSSEECNPAMSGSKILANQPLTIKVNAQTGYELDIENTEVKVNDASIEYGNTYGGWVVDDETNPTSVVISGLALPETVTSISVKVIVKAKA